MLGLEVFLCCVGSRGVPVLCWVQRCTSVQLGLQVLHQGLAYVDSGLHPQQLGGVVWKQREQLLGTRTD